MDYLLFHTFLCLFLTGLIWTIQTVHYPSFHWVDPLHFVSFSRFHQSKITLIVMPTMLLELFTGMWLSFELYDEPLIHMNLFGIILIWASTFFLSMPCHRDLSIEKRTETIDKLVLTNWPRTIIWTLRSSALFYYLARNYDF